MSIWTRVRSAITGRFVKRSEAKAHPETTVTEQVTASDKGKEDEDDIH